MNIWYLNHYAIPPNCGTPGRPYVLANSLEALGHDVINVCASEHHLRSRPAIVEDLNRVVLSDGVKYFQVPTRSYVGNGRARLMNMLDYSTAIEHLEALVSLGELPKPDILIPSCVHIFSFSPALKLARRFNAKVIYEVRDIWPLSLVEVAGVSRWHPLILWMHYLEKRAYRRADAVVSLLPKALAHMEKRGLEAKKFYYIPNGISLDEWEGSAEILPQEHRNVFIKLREQEKMIVLYAGSHGPPNALDQVLDLFELNGNVEAPYHFVFIGDGVEKEKLMQRVEQTGLSFISFLPKISKKQVPSAIREADVCFIGWQKKEIYRFGISPNKIGDYFMGRKPVLHAVKAGNDPVADAAAGISVEPYNAFQLDKALRRFCSMSVSDRDVMGRNGYSYAVENLNWLILGKKYAKICEKMIEK